MFFFLYARVIKIKLSFHHNMQLDCRGPQTFLSRKPRDNFFLFWVEPPPCFPNIVPQNFKQTFCVRSITNFFGWSVNTLPKWDPLSYPHLHIFFTDVDPLQVYIHFGNDWAIITFQRYIRLSVYVFQAFGPK